MSSKIRVRFAPSPTGGLHLGGVRTVLFNYLFARQQGGDFILRIEDTDQSRYVEGAEQYIYDCLNWCGLIPDEGPQAGGEYGPYRQSERKAIYRQYAQQLIDSGNAYYAFDTPEEIEGMRERLKSEGSGSLQYDHHVRMQMVNSLSLPPGKTKELLEAGTPHVIRIRIAPGEHLTFTDMIRGEMTVDTDNVDDKVLLKADGMPTYHLAVVVDDYLMKITHAFRGEEWLPSAPVHVLLWKYLGWLNEMPEWAHLPLILKPDGNGKLSKRDGDRLGFPVFAMNWTDPKTNELIQGFKEIGFLPEAFINMLALLGWNDGTGQEIFTLPEMIAKFSMDRVHKTGAKFDFEKAKWFNHEWIKRTDNSRLAGMFAELLSAKNINADLSYIEKIVVLIKDRCHLLADFWQQSSFFFETPVAFDTAAVLPKWSAEKSSFFESFIEQIPSITPWDAPNIETAFKELAGARSIKVGELQLPFRIMLVGAKFGPAVFEIADLLGQGETGLRIQTALKEFNKAN